MSTLIAPLSEAAIGVRESIRTLSSSDAFGVIVTLACRRHSADRLSSFAYADRSSWLRYLAGDWAQMFPPLFSGVRLTNQDVNVSGRVRQTSGLVCRCRGILAYIGHAAIKSSAWHRFYIKKVPYVAWFKKGHINGNPLFSP